jgi:hypothetical protein
MSVQPDHIGQPVVSSMNPIGKFRGGMEHIVSMEFAL